MPVRMLLIGLVVLGTGFAPAPFSHRDPKKADLKRLQGRWVAVRYRVWYDKGRSGEARGMEALVEGSRLTFYQHGRLTNRGTVRLGNAHQPRHIDFVEGNGNRARGVYRLAEDSLTVCWTYHRARPTDLTPGRDGDELFVLERKKP